MRAPNYRREDYLIEGKSGLETAVILSTEWFKFARKVPADYDMLPKLVHVVQLFEENKIRFALIGGLAVGEHSLPRATKDVDFLVDEEDMERARQLLEEYYEKGFADFMIFNVHGVRMDLISARLRFQKRGVAEAQPGMIDGVRIPIVQARDLILLKLVAAGDRRDMLAAMQDQVDAGQVVEHSKNLAPQDFQYVADRILESFCFTKEASEKYHHLLQWMNELLDKLGRPECKAKI